MLQHALYRVDKDKSADGDGYCPEETRDRGQTGGQPRLTGQRPPSGPRIAPPQDWQDEGPTPDEGQCKGEDVRHAHQDRERHPAPRWSAEEVDGLETPAQQAHRDPLEECEPNSRRADE